MLRVFELPDEYATGLIILSVLLLGAVFLIFAFVTLVRVNRNWILSGKHPQFRTYLQQAIVLAYKASDLVFDALDTRLYSTQKLEIAARLYDILPGEINMRYLPFSLNWKQFVSKDRFVYLVGLEYDRLTARFHVVKEHILEDMEVDIEVAPG